MGTRAFIFDMDGVLVDSERAWAEYERTFLPALVGHDVFARIGDIAGISLKALYGRLLEFGAVLDYVEFVASYDAAAPDVYAGAALTAGMDRLAEWLRAAGFRLGLVSSSRRNWIDRVIPRLRFESQLECITSLDERPDLRSKPWPDGYVEAMRELGSRPANSVILEDSNAGIAAAKAAGAYTIALRQHCASGDVQRGADAYANTVEDVIDLVEQFSKS